MRTASICYGNLSVFGSVKASSSRRAALPRCGHIEHLYQLVGRGWEIVLVAGSVFDEFTRRG
jgi:hypothetical protein